MQGAPATRVAVFLQWLRCLLFEQLLEAVRSGDRSEELWQAALGCLLHLVAAGGTPDLTRMAGLSTEPLAVLLSIAEDNAWCVRTCAHMHARWIPQAFRACGCEMAVQCDGGAAQSSMPWSGGGLRRHEKRCVAAGSVLRAVAAITCRTCSHGTAPQGPYHTNTERRAQVSRAPGRAHMHGVPALLHAHRE